ncbi:EmrB/QacA subfamily drug resistance transporter [Limimaricola soesokkakensis]|uniref:EmrB/QacA subfamily drug resistance transporter n=1 Tax=Limimaricola soesokkakensis TaxID=1343159 RepID=A0A1X6YC29_9RHOB|nr:MDR family MFS transporter [Limimaricola soesokkakensis]PSK87083.1 EmrB/QacA subfamily drug resistance transporter [Limimaricola soesokkakensis]SLN16996.1 Multidrug resistance protein 3 [Limimaricola soesokkakensis]
MTATPQAMETPGHHRRLAIWAVAVTLFVASTGQTIVSTALPVITADLGGLNRMTWVVTAYLLASTVGAPIFGKLGDLFGRKAVMQAGLGVFTLGALICGVAPSMEVLIAGRAVQGLGGGGLIVVAMAVVADLLPPRERSRVQGALGGVFGLSTVVGPLVGGFLVQSLGWHWIFFANLPVVAVAWVVLQSALRGRAPGARPRIDVAGAALLTATLSGLVLVTSMGGTVLGWGEPAMLALIGATLASLMGFLFVESRAVAPILPLSLFRLNAVAVVNAAGLLVGMAMFGTITFLPLYLQVVQGVSPVLSGMFLLPMMGGLIGASMVSGRVMGRTGRYKALPVASTALLALAMLGLSRLGPDTPLWQVLALMMATGLGIGPMMSVGVAAIQNAVPRSMLGVGTASANMFRLIGGSLGTSIFGAVFGAGLAQNLAGRVEGAGLGTISRDSVMALDPQLRESVLAGFAAALDPIFLLAAGIATLAFAVTLLLREVPLAEA